jgi:hypothetical protein
MSAYPEVSYDYDELDFPEEVKQTATAASKQAK